MPKVATATHGGRVFIDARDFGNLLREARFEVKATEGLSDEVIYALEGILGLYIDWLDDVSV